MATSHVRAQVIAGDNRPDRVVTLADLTRIEGKIDRLLAILEPASADAVAKLLAIIWEVIGAGTFSVRAVLDRASMVGDMRLAHALTDADVTTGKELGWLLHRLQGSAVGGYVVRRLDTARVGRLWRISRIARHEIREGAD
jgi:hypothetical protein